MSDPSEAYVLAEYIHDSFFKPGEDFTEQEITESGVRAYIAAPYRTQQLYAHGELEGERAYQTLSRSTKSGDFYLSTVYHKPGSGAYLRERITPNSPVETVKVLESTLFMRAMRSMQRARYQE